MEAKQQIRRTQIDFNTLSIGKKLSVHGIYKILDIKLMDKLQHEIYIANVTYIYKMGWSTNFIWLTDNSNITDNYKYITSITLPDYDGTTLHLFELLDV
jgi:hypothetical protein